MSVNENKESINILENGSICANNALDEQSVEGGQVCTVQVSMKLPKEENEMNREMIIEDIAGASSKFACH